MADYRQVTDERELRLFAKIDKDNIGVARNGDLFQYDFRAKKPKRISIQDAANVLNVSLDVVSKIVKSGGEYREPLVDFRVTPEQKTVPQPPTPQQPVPKTDFEKYILKEINDIKGRLK